MPVTKSAIKRVRQNERRRQRNLRNKRQIKDAAKALKAAADKPASKQTREALSEVYKQIDKAAKNHVFHAKKAARLKAKYAKLAQSPKQKPSAKKPASAKPKKS